MIDGVRTRPATKADEPLLWQMLVLAASMPGGEGDVATAQADPELRRYVAGFGRPGDLGVVAYCGDGPLGAAWARRLVGEPSPSKLWTHDVPELAIATLPSARGRGVGSLLLRALLAMTAGAIVLSVREGSPAVRLYERHGFVVERRITNRVGGVSLAMRRSGGG